MYVYIYIYIYTHILHTYLTIWKLDTTSKASRATQVYKTSVGTLNHVLCSMTLNLGVPLL